MIHIIYISDSHAHFDNAYKEYIKRLPKLKIHKLKPVKNKSKCEILKLESSLLQKYISKIKWYKVLLNITSNILDTEKFLNLINTKQINFWNIIFIVWWVYWTDSNILKDSIDYELSLSPMTFTHQLALVMLLEQIYRVSKIESWSKYHK